MAMTKDDYAELGRINCREATKGNGRPSPYLRRSPSWQAQAYWSGWDSEASAKPVTVSTATRDKKASGLPARQEHIRQLKKEINSSKIMTANRLLRISAKIAHLECREASDCAGL